uniref:hypothetical protein n=1 Tax=Mangrovicoccus sp. HB161399 TaxID=2720392 RepID=UPI001C1306DE
ALRRFLRRTAAPLAPAPRTWTTFSASLPEIAAHSPAGRRIEPGRGNLRPDRLPNWIAAIPPWHSDAAAGRLQHVWVAPVSAGARLGWHHAIEGVQVSGLSREFVPLAGMGSAGQVQNIKPSSKLIMQR